MYAFTFVAEVLVKIADSSLTRKFFLLEIYNKTNELRYALLYFIETNSNWLVLDLVSLDAFRRGYNTVLFHLPRLRPIHSPDYAAYIH